MTGGWLRRWRDALLFSRESPRNLIAARILLAANALWILLSRPRLPDLLDWPAAFWRFVPPVTTSRFGIGLIPSAAEWLLFFAVHAALLLVIVNVVPRVSAIVASLLLYHFAPFEQFLVWTSFTGLGGLTLPVLGLAIVSFAPAPRWDGERSWEFRWPLAMIQILLAFQYLLPGLVKLRVSGLRWFGPENITLESMRMAALWQPEWAHLIIESSVVAALVGAAALAVELLFPLAVVWRSSRWVLVPLAMIAHILRTKMWGLYFLNAPLLLLFVDWDALVERVRRQVRPTIASEEAAA